MSLVRSAVAAMLLLLGGIGAHHLAGGEITSSNSLMQFVLIATLVALALRGEEISETRLFFAVFAVQNLTHFLLGGANESSLLMALSHTIFGVISYQLILQSSQILNGLSSLYQSLRRTFLPKTFTFSLQVAEQITWGFTPLLATFKESAQRSAILLRAPPL